VKIISTVRPTEVYNLAAQSHVKVSFDLAEYTAEVVGVGTLRLLDAIKTCGLEKQVCHKLRVIFAIQYYTSALHIPITL